MQYDILPCHQTDSTTFSFLFFVEESGTLYLTYTTDRSGEAETFSDFYPVDQLVDGKMTDEPSNTIVLDPNPGTLELLIPSNDVDSITIQYVNDGIIFRLNLDTFLRL